MSGIGLCRGLVDIGGETVLGIGREEDCFEWLPSLRRELDIIRYDDGNAAGTSTSIITVKVNLSLSKEGTRTP